MVRLAKMMDMRTANASVLGWPGVYCWRPASRTNPASGVDAGRRDVISSAASASGRRRLQTQLPEEGRPRKGAEALRPQRQGPAGASWRLRGHARKHPEATGVFLSRRFCQRESDCGEKPPRPRRTRTGVESRARARGEQLARHQAAEHNERPNCSCARPGAAPTFEVRAAILTSVTFTPPREPLRDS